MTGVVRWFDSNRGYGFIESFDSEKDVFVHVSNIEADTAAGPFLMKDDVVEFEKGRDRHGRAIAIKVRHVPARARTGSQPKT